MAAIMIVSFLATFGVVLILGGVRMAMDRPPDKVGGAILGLAGFGVLLVAAVIALLVSAS